MTPFPFAKRMDGLTGNAIREILKLTQASDIISFAGGLPSPDSFPAEEIRRISAELMTKELAGLLQYSTTEGYPPLRSFVAQWVKERGIEASADEVLLLTGSQQGIDMACRAFLDPGDTVLVERPTYLAALQLFKLYQARVEAVTTDAEGMDIEALERAIVQHRPKLIYLVPTFRNPSGETWSQERRQAAADLARRYGVIIVEDDPYSSLRYEGSPVPAVAAYAGGGHVIYLGSFSKIVAPGLRVGYAVAHPEILRRLVIGKQAADVHTSNYSQAVVAHFCTSGALEGHIDKVCALYRTRRDCMLEAMARHFPEEVKWTHPEGGLFVWVTLPEGVSSAERLPEAIAERVAFIPGDPFFHDGTGQNTMRLNFSNASLEQIKSGIERLGRVLARAL